jgi:hypothetical protein
MCIKMSKLFETVLTTVFRFIRHLLIRNTETDSFKHFSVSFHVQHTRIAALMTMVLEM